MKMTTLFFVAILLNAVATNGADRTAPNVADEELKSFFEQYLEAEFPLRPMHATRLGDHRFDAQLDDVSLATLQRCDRLREQTLEALPRQVDYRQLSRQRQVDFEVLRDALKRMAWLEETERPWENDPRLYTSLATECVYMLLTQSTQPKETNLRNAIARIQQVPRMLASARANLRQPSRVRTETAIQQNRGAIAFYEVEWPRLLGDSPQRADGLVAARVAIDALKQQQTFLEKELSPRSTGEWRIGRERFARKAELTLDAGVSADEVLAEAEAAFAQVQRDLLFGSRQLWGKYFANRAIPPDDDDGRRETIERVLAEINRDHGAPEHLILDARDSVIQIKRFIAKANILRLPEPDVCQIIEMPEFQRGNSVAFLEPAPALDASAISIYAISPPPNDWPMERVESFLGEYNRQMLKVLTIHEAYPGHYVQLDYANRQPSLLRRVLGSGVYSEGWANYCEQMMLDQGYGDGDLALRLMQQKFFLRSIANAILDYKMHCTSMTDDEAVAFLTRQAYQGEGEARLKVIRAKLGSCQLSTYFVGRSAFMRLRATIQRELGDSFSLSRFHEAVLEQGAVPVKYLPELVRARLKDSP